ncbi:MAG: phosphoglucosamine mutase, partial [Planctomycetes bacterium]|nr:phosphoglucosamine mutase [Planctomycetota bacterium]
MTQKALECVVSVSGMRGIVGETIDSSLVLALAQAYGASIAQGGTVILGRDSRPTGPMLSQAVSAGLRAVGCDVIDIGVVPTPTVPIMIQELGASGGIQISASHNPVEWNALKYFSKDARNIDQIQLDLLLAAYEQGVTAKAWDGVGSFSQRDDACSIHQQKILNLIDCTPIQAAAPKVLIDSVNGSGSIIAPQLLRKLGCEVFELYTNPMQVFPRDPEPTAANVIETGQKLLEHGAVVGFVQDPDADRLAIIDENGVYIGEEYTLVLCAAARVAQEVDAGNKNACVCTNLSTSRMLEDVGKQYGAKIVRSAVGEANVVDAMLNNQAVMGGEGNGGIIDPRIVNGRD